LQCNFCKSVLLQNGRIDFAKILASLQFLAYLEKQWKNQSAKLNMHVVGIYFDKCDLTFNIFQHVNEVEKKDLELWKIFITIAGWKQRRILNFYLFFNWAEHQHFCSTDSVLSAYCVNRFKLILTSSVVLFTTECLLALWPTTENMPGMKFQKVFS